MSTQYDSTKKEAMLYLIEHSRGAISDLENAIGKKRIKEFEYLGYIRNGISENGKTYESSENVENDYKIFYSKKSNWYTSVLDSLFGILFGFHY